METIRTSVEVDAPPETVWAHLTDLESYPEWNPHVVSASGALEEGGRLRIRVHRAGTRDRELTVTVTDVEPGRLLAWVGTVVGGAVFRARHSFELEPLDGGGTRLHNSEEVTGLLASSLLTDVPERDYAAMNRALKARVERATADPHREGAT
jgi:hypothetical protein